MGAPAFFYVTNQTLTELRTLSGFAKHKKRQAGPSLLAFFSHVTSSSWYKQVCCGVSRCAMRKKELKHTALSLARTLFFAVLFSTKDCKFSIYKKRAVPFLKQLIH